MRPEDYKYTRLGMCIIPCKAISKSNSKTYNRRLDPKYAAFENTVGMLTRACFGQKQIVEGWLDVQLYFKEKRHIDVSNSLKSLLDGMVKGGSLKDDKMIACSVFPAIYGNSEKIELTLWRK